MSSPLSQQQWSADFEAALRCHKQGRTGEALSLYCRALNNKEDHAPLHYNLGVLLLQNKEYAKAYESFQCAIRFDAQMPEACYAAGNVASIMGKLNEAIQFYLSALDVKPDDADTHYNLANTYKKLQMFDPAEQHYRKALRLAPSFTDAMNNLAVLRMQAGDYHEAICLLLKAIQCNAQNQDCLYNLSLTYKRSGDVDSALKYLRMVLRINPAHAEGSAMLVVLLQQICAWEKLSEAERHLDRLTQCQLENHEKPVESPFLNFTRIANVRRNLSVARAWAAWVKTNLYTNSTPYAEYPARRTKNRITIGYLSEQFRDAATAHLTAALFENHNHQRFQINAYSLGRDDYGYYRKKIIRDVDRFADLRNLGSRQAADCIFNDHVDILVDLIGWMHGHRIAIPALRPAPVQVNYLGYPGTMGADFIDYIFADRVVIPKEHIGHYAEKVVYLPNCYQVTDPNPPVSDDIPSRQACGLPEDQIVFCCFCTDYKIDSEVFNAWMDILRFVPQSVLWLLVRTRTAQQNLCSAAVGAGINPDRLIFAQPCPKDRHLARLKLADIALDTFIVNGHTTTSDALFAGVPVVTKIGGHFASRVAASILAGVGLTELITTSITDYVSLATSLAMDKQRLSDLKTGLINSKLSCPLFDIKAFVSGMETAYLTIWDLNRRGLPPRSFSVVAN